MTRSKRSVHSGKFVLQSIQGLFDFNHLFRVIKQ